MKYQFISFIASALRSSPALSLVSSSTASGTHWRGPVVHRRTGCPLRCFALLAFGSIGLGDAGVWPCHRCAVLTGLPNGAGCLGLPLRQQPNAATWTTIDGWINRDIIWQGASGLQAQLLRLARGPLRVRALIVCNTPPVLQSVCEWFCALDDQARCAPSERSWTTPTKQH